VAQQTTFMQQAMPWLDAQPYVSRYAWQWCDPSAGLVASSGVPTALGNTYAYTPSDLELGWGNTGFTQLKTLWVLPKATLYGLG